MNYSNEEKIKEIYKFLYKYLYVVLREESLAQDLTQETLYKYIKCKIVFSDDASERAWILTVASNMCKNYWRSVWYKKVIPLTDNFEIIQISNPEIQFKNVSEEEQELIINQLNFEEVLHEKN